MFVGPSGKVGWILNGIGRQVKQWWKPDLVKLKTLREQHGGKFPRGPRPSYSRSKGSDPNKMAPVPGALPDQSADGAPQEDSLNQVPKIQRGRRGRKKGYRNPKVSERIKRMLDAWDRGDFGNNKAVAGRKCGFGRSEATKIINDHERKKCRI